MNFHVFAGILRTFRGIVFPNDFFFFIESHFHHTRPVDLKQQVAIRQDVRAMNRTDLIFPLDLALAIDDCEPLLGIIRT